MQPLLETMKSWRVVIASAKNWQVPTCRYIPRSHFLAVIVLSGLLLLTMLFVPSEDVAASRHQSILLPLPDLADDGTDIIDHYPDDYGVDTAPVLEEAKEPRLWKQEVIRPGDNLTSIFKRLSLNNADVYAVANAGKEASALKHLRPDEVISVATDDKGELAAVKYQRSLLESYVYTKSGAAFSGEKVVRHPDLLPAFRTTIIENSLFLDGEQAGLSHNLIMQIANVFGWDIDFALDIRQGDSFSILYEEKYLDGEKIGTGDILAAEFSNQGEVYRAVRFVEGDGSINYYTPDGQPMRKAFLRAPLDFTRISSNFNLKRKHPIHKMIKAHRGVDYAAPRGTPVYAAGDGKVIAAGYSKANGNYVFIQHGQKYTTKYLHLNKKAVKSGQSVRQRQVIGTVGSTGYATGPHLHYEFLVNGIHHNPRTVKLPKADPIAQEARPGFIQQTTPLLAQLDSLRNVQLAQATPE